MPIKTQTLIVYKYQIALHNPFCIKRTANFARLTIFRLITSFNHISSVLHSPTDKETFAAFYIHRFAGDKISNNPISLAFSLMDMFLCCTNGTSFVYSVRINRRFLTQAKKSFVVEFVLSYCAVFVDRCPKCIHK